MYQCGREIYVSTWWDSIVEGGGGVWHFGMIVLMTKWNMPHLAWCGILHLFVTCKKISTIMKPANWTCGAHDSQKLGDLGWMDHTSNEDRSVWSFGWCKHIDGWVILTSMEHFPDGIPRDLKIVMSHWSSPGSKNRLMKMYVWSRCCCVLIGAHHWL